MILRKTCHPNATQTLNANPINPNASILHAIIKIQEKLLLTSFAIEAPDALEWRPGLAKELVWLLDRGSAALQTRLVAGAS